MSIESVMLSSHPILCCHLLFFPSIFPSISVLSNEWALHIKWPKYWSFGFSNSSSSEYSRLISLRIDWFDLLAVQGLSRVFSSTTIKKHQFFCAQSSLWSNSLIHTWLLRNHSFDYMTFVGKVMSLLFNTLSRFVIASFPRSKHLLISRLQSLSTVILEPKKTKSVTASPFPPYICREVIRLASMILAFSMLSYKPASLQIHILKSSSPGHQNGTLSGDGVSKKQ